jgi:hypothetical protein
MFNDDIDIALLNGFISAISALYRLTFPDCGNFRIQSRDHKLACLGELTT